MAVEVRTVLLAVTPDWTVVIAPPIAPPPVKVPTPEQENVPALTTIFPAVTVSPPAVIVAPARIVTAPASVTKTLSALSALFRSEKFVAPGMSFAEAALNVMLLVKVGAPARTGAPVPVAVVQTARTPAPPPTRTCVVAPS